MNFFEVIRIGILTIFISSTAAGITVAFHFWQANDSNVSQFQPVSYQVVSGTPTANGTPAQTSYQLVLGISPTDGTPGQPSQNGGNTGGAGGNSGNSGPQTVPEINAAAAPTALALLAGGLLLFQERSRRARRSDGRGKGGLTDLTV